MTSKEGEHLEFKEAKHRYDFEELVRYCAAFANEGGGLFVLGVTDKIPRKIVGTESFPTIEQTKASLIDRLALRIDIEEIIDQDRRVLVFHIPSRPLGVPIVYKGAYWMRGGENLVPMTLDQIKRIISEAEPDFSAEVCTAASIEDLEIAAIEDFRRRWLKKSQNPSVGTLSLRQLLVDTELLVDDGLTNAALILFGTRQTLGKYLSHAEVIFEYRASDATGPAQQRLEYRQGFFSFYDDLWDKINLRNDIQYFQDGLFIWNIPTFNESVVRESILNAVSHRDYRSAGSVFVRQYPRRLEVVSPGGLPPGITPENILWQQYPRNRRIAEAFARCGLVERSGQGMNRIFEECIKETKPKPDFKGTDHFQVWLTLRGDVLNPQFLKFLEKIGSERLKTFATQDFLIIDRVSHNQPIPDALKDRLPYLVDQGIVERVGRRYILSRQFYKFIGKKGAYTRHKGLDRETNKALLFKHINDNRGEGSKLKELMEVLPFLSSSQIQKLLRELKEEKRIHVYGKTSAARWYPEVNDGRYTDE
jgi:ATP-dependent DNA helicase RecG